MFIGIYIKMSLDICVNIDPLKIRNNEELESIIIKIKKYEKETKTKAGVGKLQNLSLGSSYLIVSKYEAYKDIKKANISTSEFFIKFYPLSYFEALREKYNH